MIFQQDNLNSKYFAKFGAEHVEVERILIYNRHGIILILIGFFDIFFGNTSSIIPVPRGGGGGGGASRSGKKDVKLNFFFVLKFYLL